jgi:lysophospholipase L1-like esterase
MRNEVFFDGVVCLLVLLAFLLLSCGSNQRDATSGSLQLPDSWYYVALGDSLGVGALALEGYVPRYADFIRQDTKRPVTLVNLSRSGWTSTDLLNALRQDSRFRTELQKANVVTFDIGGNDLLAARGRYLRGECGGSDNLECFRQGVAQFKSNLDGIIAELLKIKSPANTIIRTMDIYNPYVGVHAQRGDLELLNPFLDQVNSYIASSAKANGILMAPVHGVFNGPAGTDDPVNEGLISQDGFHANDFGHEAIATELRKLGYSPFQLP